MLVAKNEDTSSLIKLQKEHFALDVSQMLNKYHQELENTIFDMKEELQALDIRLVCAGSNQSIILSLQ